MSKNIRIGLVAEGPTDHIVIESALSGIFGNTAHFTCSLIQPDTTPSCELGGESDASLIDFVNPGWSGVYKWCRGVASKGSDDIFRLAALNFDVLIIHLDADVSRSTYEAARVTPVEAAPLPCAGEGEKAESITNKMEKYIKIWLEPVVIGNSTVFCIPSDNTETWAYIWKNPNKVLTTPTRHVEDRKDLVGRIKKTQKEYKIIAPYIKNNWQVIEEACPRAKLFSAAIRPCFSA